MSAGGEFKQGSAGGGGSGGGVDVDPNAINLRWSFGFNTQIVSAVHNLTTPTKKSLFYVSSHTGVIHDTDSDKQHLLQGHCNPITAVAVSADKRWLATADTGPKSMIIIWDSWNASAVKVLPLDDDDKGVASLDISADSMFVVSLSQGFPQKITVWEWTVPTKKPAIVSTVKDSEFQNSVRFNPVDVRDIVTTGLTKVVFWNWTQDALVAFKPPRGIKKLKKTIGDLTETMFIPFTTKAVTATVSGHVVLWDYPVSELVQSSGWV
jgi:WD40 repeat protein